MEDEIVGKQKLQISKIINAPIIVAVIGVILTVILSTQKTELRYTLSDEIPINLTNEKIQNVQQLVIKNTGDVLAEKIVININGKIEKYSIISYSKTDVVEEFLEENSLQLVYPELPEKGLIQITFISGRKIQDADIEIKYNKGLAEEALSSGMDADIFIMLCYVIFAGLIIGGVYKAATDFNVEYYYQRYLKRRKKFWYINNERWDTLRKESVNVWQKKLLEETIECYNISNIDQTRSFKFLNEKPEYLLSDEWEILRNTAEKAWSILQREFLCYPHIDREEKFIKYLKLEKPTYLNELEWRKSREDILNMMKFKQMEYYDREGIEKAYHFLNRKKESYFNENEWKELINIAFSYLKNKFYEILNEVKEYQVEKLEKYFLMICPLSIDEEKWKEMQEDIYILYIRLNLEIIKNKVEYNCFSEAIELMSRACPLNLPKEYWQQYLVCSKKIVESQLIRYIYESSESGNVESAVRDLDLSILNQNKIETILYDVLSARLLQKSVEKNIEKISIPQWVKERQLFNLEKYLVQKGQFEELLEQTKLEKAEVDKLKARITKQLELVDSVLRDPKALDYIEDYCDIFSTGNFENLRKVARKLTLDSAEDKTY